MESRMMKIKKVLFILLCSLNYSNAIKAEEVEKTYSIKPIKANNKISLPGPGTNVGVGFKDLGSSLGSGVYSLDVFGAKKSSSTLLSGTQFAISCDFEIDKSECAEQINHYSILGLNNTLMHVANNLSCGDVASMETLDSISCEKRLNCATRGNSRGFLTKVCVPSRKELEMAIPQNDYNDHVGHALIRNLTVGEEAEKIEKFLFETRILGVEEPVSCQKNMDENESDCTKTNLDLLAKSYKSFSKYFENDSSESLNIYSQDLSLKFREEKKAGNILSTLKRFREIRYADSNTDGSALSEERSKDLEEFKEVIFQVTTQNKNSTGVQIASKIQEAIKAKIKRNEISPDSQVIANHLHSAGEDRLVELVVEFSDKIKDVKNSAAIRDQLNFVFKRHVTKQANDLCNNTTQFNLKNTCEVLNSMQPMVSRSNEMKFKSFPHRRLLSGKAIAFLENKPIEKTAFFIRACENTDMGQQFVRYVKDESRKSGGSGGSSGSRDNTDDDTVVSGGRSVGELQVADSTIVKGVVADPGSPAAVAENNIISSELANVFNPQNGITSGFNSGVIPPEPLLPDSSLLPAESDSEEKEVKNKRERKNADEDNESIANDKQYQRFDALQKEIEGLRAQLNQKNNEVQKTPSPAGGTAEDKESEALRNRIAELEREMAKPKVQPKKNYGFDSVEDSLWSRNSGTDVRRAPSSEGTLTNSGATTTRSNADSTSGSQSGTSSINNRSQNQAAAGTGSSGGSGLSLTVVKFENQSMVVLPQSATTQDVVNKIIELGGKPFFIENADGSYTYVEAELDKNGKPILKEDGTPKYLVKKVASDKVTPVKARGVSSVKVTPVKVRDLKELKDPATRKRELDELLKKTKKD